MAYFVIIVATVVQSDPVIVVKTYLGRHLN